ncbi:MAG: hypothetical protein VW378_02570 [bacterium]
MCKLFYPDKSFTCHTLLPYGVFVGTPSDNDCSGQVSCEDQPAFNSRILHDCNFDGVSTFKDLNSTLTNCSLAAAEMAACIVRHMPEGVGPQTLLSAQVFQRPLLKDSYDVDTTYTRPSTPPSCDMTHPVLLMFFPDLSQYFLAEGDSHSDDQDRFQSTLQSSYLYNYFLGISDVYCALSSNTQFSVNVGSFGNACIDTSSLQRPSLNSSESGLDSAQSPHKTSASWLATLPLARIAAIWAAYTAS